MSTSSLSVEPTTFSIPIHHQSPGPEASSTPLGPLQGCGRHQTGCLPGDSHPFLGNMANVAQSSSINDWYTGGSLAWKDQVERRKTRQELGGAEARETEKEGTARSTEDGIDQCTWQCAGHCSPDQGRVRGTVDAEACWEGMD